MNVSTDKSQTVSQMKTHLVHIPKNENFHSSGLMMCCLLKATLISIPNLTPQTNDWKKKKVCLVKEHLLLNGGQPWL